ncbi:MAG: hypothetical protein PHY67_02550 [Methanocorpusculum sp.]|nr:hypothetical protein [Methanocorpusculum sp.]
MKCSRCSKEAVLTQSYSGLSLCGTHAAADIEAKARKELRQKGGLPSGSRVFVEEDNTFRTFALRIFLGNLLAKRTDVLFVKSPEEAGLILSAGTLDDAALYVLESVCAGTQDLLVAPGDGRISPLSVIPADEVCWYAKRHGFSGEKTVSRTDAAEFLETFRAGHPAALYALKNVGDALKKENK